jgi:hypothetical protein
MNECVEQTLTIRSNNNNNEVDLDSNVISDEKGCLISRFVFEVLQNHSE